MMAIIIQSVIMQEGERERERDRDRERDFYGWKLEKVWGFV